MAFGSAFGSAAAEAALGDLAARLRSFEGDAEGAAVDCAAAVAAEQSATASSGQDAYGRTWTPTKEGKRPMAGASSAVEVSGADKQIRVGISGYHVAHHIGWAKGYGGGTKMRRPIIPENRSASGAHQSSGGKGIPQKWADAIRGVLRSVLGLS
jgi:hypothetical protein